MPNLLIQYIPKAAIGNNLSTKLVCSFCNHLLLGQDFASSIHALNEKIICLFVKDLNKQFHIKIENGLLCPAKYSRNKNKEWSVRISGDFKYFKRLGFRQEDPDTLFFQRKLELEGDIEAGLIFKNILDSIDYDWPSHFKSVLTILRAPFR